MPAREHLCRSSAARKAARHAPIHSIHPKGSPSGAMEFGFRAGDRSPRRPCPCPVPDRPFHTEMDRDRRLPASESPRSRGAGPFHGEPPPPSPFEWEAAARRERIIREEVDRRLVEEGVRRELARFHGGFGAVPFVAPDGHTIVPPPPPGLFFMSPMPLPQMPVGMHPNCPPPALFGSWEGFGLRRLPGFGQPMLPNEATTRPVPPPKPRHQLQLREIAPSESYEVLSSETKVSGAKRKADVSSATAKPTKLQTVARDWSCALCRVSATSEAGLNQHLEGKKHKAKLVQCGAIKVINVNKSGLQVTTRNNDGAGPSDAPKKIHILVDGEMYQVVQKSNCVWCEPCRVSCTNAAAMADHLRGKKHSLLNKVWTSIKAVRMNKDVKEDSAATCETERKVTENGSTGIPDEHKEEDTYMTSEFSGDGSFEIRMEMKETTDMAEEVDANSHNVIRVEIKKEDIHTAGEVNGNCAGGTKQEGTDVDMVMDVNKNFLLKAHQKPRNKAIKKFLSKVHQKSRKKTNKKFLFKVHQKSRKKAHKNFLLKVHQKPRPKKWIGIREVNEISSTEIPAEERHNDRNHRYAATNLAESAREEE